MCKLLELPDQPTAVLCTSDLMAIGAINAIHDNGQCVPRDISIVGFDNTNIAELFNPGLTTVNQNIKGLGTKATEYLLAMIDNPDFSPPVQVESVNLVVRKSTGPAR